jgi:integrase
MATNKTGKAAAKRYRESQSPDICWSGTCRYFPRLRALVMLAGFRTSRPGELLGLQRRDIDLLHGTVHVERQAHEITGQGRVIVEHPKSEAGTRTLTLPDRNELRHHLDTYVSPEPDACVFTRPSGRALRPSDFSNYWREACAVVGTTGVHPHDRRTTLRRSVPAIQTSR